MLKMVCYVLFVVAAVMIHDSTMVPIAADSTPVLDKIDESPTPMAFGATPMDKRETETEVGFMELMNDTHHGRPNRKAVAAPNPQSADDEASTVAAVSEASTVVTQSTQAQSNNGTSTGTKNSSTTTNLSNNLIIYLTLPFFGRFIINF